MGGKTMTTITGGADDDIIKGTKYADILLGGAGDDFLQGKAGDDLIDGGQGNDQLQGNEGDDTITGGEGDDFIHGGIGTDTAVYSGSVLDYTFARSGENLYVNHSGGTGLDGNDVLLHIEKLQFNDILIDLTQNNAPLAFDDVASTHEDVGTFSSGAVSVLDNDFDWEGDALTATPGTFNGVYGTLVLAANGTYTYTPYASSQALAQGEVVQDVFSYTVSDGSLSDTGTLTINLAGVNDAPVANADVASTGENTVVLVDVLANDTDIDTGAVLTLASAAAPVGQGSASIVGNQIEFDPGTDFAYLASGETAIVVVSYTIQDEHGATSSSTVTITVSGTNDAPVANDDTATTDENTTVSGNVLANDTDAQNDPLTVTDPGVYVGTYGTLTLNADGSYTYAPDAAADGLAAGEQADDAFTYTVSDGTGSDTATLTVTVNGLNDAPTIDAGGTDADGAVSELPDGDPGEGTTVHTDSGAIAFADLDLTDTHSASATPQGASYLGTFTLAPVDQAEDSVGWHFSVSDAALDGLSEGEVLIQTYAIEIDDGNGGTVTQNVSITITGAGLGAGPQTLWHIDNSAAGSANLGTAADPFTSIAAFNAAQGSPGGPQATHTVYLHAGTGTGVYAEADGINLLDGQILIGVSSGPIRPTIEASAGDGINVAQDNNISGLDIGDTSGADIADSGGTVGNLVISDVGSSGTGQIIDIDQGGTLNVTLNAAASTSSTGGAIDLNAVSGTFTVSGATTIAGATGGGVDVTASVNLAVGFQGGLSASTGASTAVNFSGNMGSSSLALSGLSLTTTTGTGLNVTNGGTVTVSGAGNTIATTGGTAVNISFATIGAGGVTFDGVSSIGGTAAGIILNTAGSGGFEVGGGTIANKVGTAGVSINATSDVSLANMAITGNAGGGIVGTNVSDFSLTGSTLTNNGSSAAQGGVYFTGLTGTAGLLGNVIGGSSGNNVHIVQTGGSLDLEIADSGTAQAIMGTVNAVTGNDSVFVQTLNSATLTLVVDGVDFQGARGDLLQVLADDQATQTLTLTNNNFHNLQAGTGGGVTLNGGGPGSNLTVDFFVENNSFTGAVGSAFSAVYAQQSGMVRGNIRGNTIGIDDGVAGTEGSSGGGSGIFVSLEKEDGAGNAGLQVSIVDNNIADIDSGVAGIHLRANGGDAVNSAILEATVTGNEVDEFGDFAFAALAAQLGGFGTDFARLGLILQNNVLDLSDADFGSNAIYLEQVSPDAGFYFPGYTGSPDGEFSPGAGTASTDLDAFWASQGNAMVNGGFPTFPGGVDAGLISGATGDFFIL
jgi:VCBS repeat-containing protein